MGCLYDMIGMYVVVTLLKYPVSKLKMAPCKSILVDIRRIGIAGSVREKDNRGESNFGSKLTCHGLDNIQDWCISRQLWWGHEIPAYQVKLAGKENKGMHKGCEQATSETN